MPAPNWNMKNWTTGKPMSFFQALGFKKNLLNPPKLGAKLPAVVQSSAGGSGGSSGNVEIGHVGRSVHDFAIGVLRGIGAPVNSANVRSIEAWAQREGGGGAWNPLNTTQQMPGSTTFNSVGVQNYPNMLIGVHATIDTLLGNPAYNDVIGSLRNGSGLCGRTYSGLSTWSGGGYSSVC